MKLDGLATQMPPGAVIATTPEPHVRSALDGDWCHCHLTDSARIGPCARHAPEVRNNWLKQSAPRLAAALADGDPFVQVIEQRPQADQVPEFAPLRDQLSDIACAFFDHEWAINVEVGEYPHLWEDALTVRDRWRELAPAVERDALRRMVADLCDSDVYPVGESFWELFDSGPAAPEHLEREADKLGNVARHALELEQMIRDHLAAQRHRSAQP